MIPLSNRFHLSAAKHHPDKSCALGVDKVHVFSSSNSFHDAFRCWYASISFLIDFPAHDCPFHVCSTPYIRFYFFPRQLSSTFLFPSTVIPSCSPNCVMCTHKICIKCFFFYIFLVLIYKFVSLREHLLLHICIVLIIILLYYSRLDLFEWVNWKLNYIDFDMLEQN